MAKRELVAIYSDPLTKTKLEGVAYPKKGYTVDRTAHKDFDICRGYVRFRLDHGDHFRTWTVPKDDAK